MSRIPKPQEIYRHFKGNLYQIITVANHSETGEQLVIYQALYGDYKVYARELSMFTSLVDREKYPNATQEYRFELQPIGSAAEHIEKVTPWVEPAHNEATLVNTVKEEANKVEEGKPEVAKAEVTSTEENKTEATKTEVDKTKETKTDTSNEAASEEEANLDPMLLQFLDADGYEEKLNVLAALHHRITQDMITIMAVASDVEVAEGELEERYAQLRNCLLTLEKYECNRMR